MDKKNHDDIQEKANFANALLDALPNPIYYKDVEGNFIRCNTRFADLAGTCKNKIIGKSAYDLFPKREADRHKIIDQEIMKTLQPYNDDVHFVKKDGEIRYYNLSKAVCLDEKGNLSGIVCIMSDLTERIREKSLLIQKSKFVEMGEMIASIAHQWNEPLVELSAQIQKMELCYTSKKINQDKVSHFVKDSMVQIQYMSETLSDFRNFLKPSVVKKMFPLKKAIKEVFDIVGKQLFYFNIEVDFEYENDEEIYLYGYKNEFKQAVLNIVNNAKNKIINLEDTKNFKGIIIIKVDVNDSHTSIEIIDNAGAIKDDIMDLLFDPYFTTKDNSTGIGLYMVKIIIEEKMSGKTSVRNSGESVIFKIEVPNKDENNENIIT